MLFRMALERSSCEFKQKNNDISKSKKS